MLDHLFDYNRQANDWFIAVLGQNPMAENLGEAHRLFSHVLNAHAIWLARIKGEPAPYGVWDMHPVGEYEKINGQLHGETAKVMAHFPPDSEVSYANSRGNNYTNQISEVLFHVINHGTHHRAQVAQLLRKAGMEPPASDYIFYLRK